MEKSPQIVFKDLDRSDFLEGLINERISRLGRFHPNILGCRVVIHTPHRSAEGGKPAIGISIEVEIPGRTLVAKGAEERREAKNDHTAVVNRAFEAIERQLSQHSAVRQGEVKAHDSVGETGLVVRLFPEQDYGFVEIKGASDLHFTRNAVVGGDFNDLQVGNMVLVTRAAGEGAMGPQASSVRLLDRARSIA